MQLGLILTGGSRVRDVELALRAEAAGFDSVFSVELFNQHGYAVLGAIAASTQRIRIGSGIANSFTRSPVVHATAAMDLDELSKGRFVLGLGSGTRRMNEEWYGMPFSEPAARTEELVQLLRALFAGQKGPGFRFQGKYWSLAIPAYHRRPMVRADIPIWLAGVNERMVRAAGSVADALIGHPIASRRWHRERTLPQLREAALKADRPEKACRLVPYVMTSIADDRETAIRDAKNQIGFYLTVQVYHSIARLHGVPEVADACRKALRSFDFAAMREAIPDWLVDEMAIACTPDEAPERLRQWEELCDEALLYAPTAGVAPERVKANLDAMLEIFGRN